LRNRPGAAAAQVIEQGGGAGQPSRFKEGEVGMLQLVVDHADHLFEALPQQRISEIGLGFSQAMKP